MYDVVIRGGTVVDGTGSKPFLADVAIVGDRIVAVGSDLGPAEREIDATGQMVTPGFVDMHTHYDGQVTWDPHLTPSGWHGVTTVVMGNCGVGFAPCRKEDRPWLINVMEGVEDIPGSALAEGIQWDWETFPEYMDALEKHEHALDFAVQVPHSAVRGYVMGLHDSENEQASEAQIAEMKAIVKESLEAGALGFSTSRTPLHRTAEGVFVAGTFAEIRELKGICEALSETGKGIFEVADEHMDVPKDLSWLEEIAVDTGRPVVFNLSQTDFASELWKKGLEGVNAAAERGVPLYAQSAGRAIGILMCWRGTAHPFALTPTWKRLSELPWEEALAALKTDAVREAILSEKPENPTLFEAYVTQSFQKMFPLGECNYEPTPEESVAAVAKATGRDPKAIAYDILMEEDGTGFIYFPLFNFSDGNLDLLHELHSNPNIKMGLSDGGAHCGAICDGGMPTFMLTFWSRDRKRGTLPVEHIVRRQTKDTAEFYGLFDRGVLKPGYRADVNVIDYDNLRLRKPVMAYDLPAGGRRLIQAAEGYTATFVAGQLTMWKGEATGAMPGKLIRGEQAAPAEAVAAK
ncbi:MAG: D-aminoacylase [Deltaproteobacteria bacterium]|nr:MAG: D-aminoacylase [Deltaproteobacteria bacterium]